VIECLPTPFACNTCGEQTTSQIVPGLCAGCADRYIERVCIGGAGSQRQFQERRTERIRLREGFRMLRGQEPDRNCWDEDDGDEAGP